MKSRLADITTTLLVLEVVERHRGTDDANRFLRKLSRTLKDMLNGRAVRPWRLERARCVVRGRCCQKSRVS